MTVTVDTYVQTWMTRAWKDRDRSVIDELIATDHTSVGAGEPIEGRDGWRGFFDTLTGAMDDIDITVDGQITEGDIAAARWSGTMTHSATGTKIPLSGILHVQVQNGEAVYGWNCIDWLPALFTLGYVQPDVMDRLLAS